jgi:MYXO-CTERM domain-containing protein
MRQALPLAAGFLATTVLTFEANAEVVELGPTDNVEARINAAQPGDEIVLRGGTYTLNQRFSIDDVRGTQAAPIVFRAKDGEVPIIHQPDANQNVIDVVNAEYLIFRGLEISGGSHGLRLIQARFVTVEGCNIHDTGDVALSANSGGSYQGLRILRNNIHHTNNTGEGMYLGCNSNACRMFDSLIEGNYVHHTNGPTVDQGDGIEIKEGSYNNIVRNNVIHDTNYPCILTYSTVGNGAPNILEANVMWNCGDHGIQSAADAVIRNNIILGSNAHGIAMQPHQAGVPGNLTVVHNTILHPTNDAINVSGAAGSIVIANNAVYAQSGNAIRVAGTLGGVVVAGNVGMGALSGPSGGLIASGTLAADFVAASFSGQPPNNVFPKAGSKLIAAGNATHVVQVDFNGTARNGVADVGAYKFDAMGNPGWPIGPGPKDRPPTGGAGGTGGSGAGGAGTGGGSTGSGGGGTAGSASGAAGSGAASGAGGSTGGAAGASGGSSGGAAGASGGVSGAGAAASGGSSGSANAAQGSGDDGGCGCRTTSSRRSPLVLAALALGVALALRRRRAR